MALDDKTRALVEACVERIKSGKAGQLDTPAPQPPINPRTHRRPGLQRFTYWNDDRLDPTHNGDDINSRLLAFAETTPLDERTPDQRAAEYKTAATTDPNAFKAFLAAYLDAIDSEWVRTQLKEWALTGRSALAVDAIRWWAHQHSTMKPEALARAIWRDQWIYLHVSRWRQQGVKKSMAMSRAQRIFRRRHKGQTLSTPLIIEVCFEYEQQLQWWLKRWPLEQWPVSPRLSRLHFMRAMTRRLRRLQRRNDLLRHPTSE